MLSFSWFGLEHPLVYAAHKAAGGITSVSRQIGIGCELFRAVLMDALGLSEEGLPGHIRSHYRMAERGCYTLMRGYLLTPLQTLENGSGFETGCGMSRGPLELTKLS